ncbi:MAG TPA: PAS domain-containing protein, partial [Gallionella sp.]|nr:PAS domain-containing protein [Gallionella sp.]
NRKKTDRHCALRRRIARLAVGIAILFLCLPGVSRAAPVPDGWRAEVVGVRGAAENDPSQDYRDAQHLQTGQPAVATAREENAAPKNSGTQHPEFARHDEAGIKQRQLDQMSLRNERMWFMLGGSVLLGMTALFLLRLRRSHRLLEVSNEQLRQSQDKIGALNARLEQSVLSSSGELRQQTRYLHTLFETLPVTVWLKDTESRYLAINAPIKDRTPEEVIGKTDLELWPDDIGAVLRASDLEVMQMRRRSTSEVSIRAQDGRIFWREIDKAPVIDEDGSVLGTVGVSRDITERRRLEVELANREREFRTLAENAPDNIVRYDLEGRIVYLNALLEQTLGVRAADIIGKLDCEIHPDGSFDAYIKELNRVLASGEDGEVELEFTGGDNGKHYHHVRMVAERDEGGRLTGVLSIGRDITGLKRYEEAREAALAEATRLANSRSEFLAHMSHELRTPLNGILGYTQILQRDKTLGERGADALNVIRHSGEHLLSLIEDILDLARIEAGHGELATSNFALNPLLSIVAEIVGVLAREKELEFSCDLAADLPQGIRVDVKRLRQVLLNLLVNAVKFTDTGRVVLRVSRVTASRLAFAIEDTGCGIAASELETIFQPFEQSGEGRQRFGGTGLGLSISRQLVRLMGGDIAVASRIGEGSTFRFELELPAVDIAPLSLTAVPDAKASTETQGDDSAGALILPPDEEIQTLYRLAQLGSMRDILLYAERIGLLDPRYRPFAARLQQMAENYQSQAILAYAERILHHGPG